MTSNVEKLSRQLLEAARVKFRASLPSNAATLWTRFPGRTGVVLSGGGARGAYEAGVLLAFQDASMPTHLLAATSIGSINAASYAAHSDPITEDGTPGFVGNAEHCVESWMQVSPPAVGIDWFRYILVLAGLTCATAGFGNFIREWVHEQGIYVHFGHPLIAWFAFGLMGTAVVFLYDQLSYMGHVVYTLWHRGSWKPDKKKVSNSALANVLVWGGALVALSASHLHVAATEVLDFTSRSFLLGVAAIAFVIALGYRFRTYVSLLSHRFLRIPLRSGLFPNFERTRFLRDRIPADGLKRSAICVLMSAADVNSGAETYFINRPVDELFPAGTVSTSFTQGELHCPQDPLLAMIASSAFPMVYEAVPMQGRLWTDGGIISNQPIRPAIRMGVDVLFLMLLEPRHPRRDEIKTFLDLGVRAMDILRAQNLRTDLNSLNTVNALCEEQAVRLGVRPEQLRVRVGERHYRYVKAFTIEPDDPLPTAILDFSSTTAAPAILQGYLDGARAVHSFADYVAAAPEHLPVMEVELVAASTANIRS